MKDASRRERLHAHALGFIDSGARAEEVIATLVRVLESDDVDRVRAQAAESVTQLLRFKRGRLRADAERVLIHHLTDESPDVRFWCAYAVGELGTKAAIAPLERLRKDRTVVPGWWSVGMEARDALTAIADGAWPDRRRRAR